MSVRLDAAARARQRGAALLTVLVLTATMSALAVAMLDDILFTIRRTGDVRVAEQAAWYALGAEALGVAAIRRSLEQEPDRADLRSLWARGEQRLPIAGGQIVGRVRDGGNCFNVNSLVRPEGAGRLRRNPESAERFLRLLTALEIDRLRASALVDAAVDWLDDDARPGARGAEDYSYAGRPVPFRTAGAPMADISELRALEGVDVALYRRLEPFVCAHPSHDTSRLNVNTLAEAGAPLLVMLVGADLTPARARDVLADRPEGGFARLEDFWAHPAFADIEVTEAMRGEVALSTQYFEVAAEIRFRGHALSLSSLYRHEGGARLTRLNREMERPA